MKPIVLDVISLVPGLYKFCPPCELASQGAGLKQVRDRAELNEYPEDVKNDYLYLSQWIKEISEKYQGRISIRLIDAQSFQGFFKCVRHLAFRHPTFIVNGRKTYSGKNKSVLDSLIHQQSSAA
jgi:hypothetical protein